MVVSGKLFLERTPTVFVEASPVQLAGYDSIEGHLWYAAKLFQVGWLVSS
jgi:hypothetical protein